MSFKILTALDAKQRQCPVLHWDPAIPSIVVVMDPERLVPVELPAGKWTIYQLEQDVPMAELTAPKKGEGSHVEIPSVRVGIKGRKP